VQQVLVLNASYEPLNVCSLRRAHVLVFKGKAEVVEELNQPLRSATDTFRWPHVIRLVHYVRVPRTIQRKISPHEVHMELPARPSPPAPVLFIRLSTPKIPQRWEPYLAPYATRTAAAA
jgi:hypothetical protein